jgi:nitrogen-specific signal transduction histidine kinase
VEQQDYIFETLWSKAIPARRRIREIEEGIMRPETRVLGKPEEILAEMTRMNDHSNEMSICVTSGGLQFTRNFLFDLIKRLLDRQGEGKHRGIKYITNINGEDLALVREFLDLGMQIRHAKYMPPMSFAVSEKEMGATIEKIEGNRMVQSLLMSNELLYAQHFKSIFEELWKGGIDAAERIKEIEQGVQAANIEIIHNPKQALERAWDLIRSSQREVLLMFSTTGAFQRQLQMGGMQIIKEAIKSGTKIRMLLPADDLIKDAIAQAKTQLPQVEIRMMDKSLQAKITIVAVDRKECMLFELNDDSKKSSYEAVGLSMHSSSKTIVLSYASIFYSLWNQTELYEQLASANEQLEVHDKMQQEFINIAAHELRTPIQPILGMAEMLEEELGDRSEEIRMIVRNARRLEELTRNILDVSKIESQSLKLDMKEFNLNDVILNAIEDYSDKLASGGVRLLYQPVDIFVRADMGRITQVISNLLSNALKFTEDGTITVAAHKNGRDIVFSISDTGAVIDQEIFPRLFTKFATKSTRGTGLGLFISRSIIESHGGRIWAENNRDGRGATLSFSIPALQ